MFNVKIVRHMAAYVPICPIENVIDMSHLRITLGRIIVCDWTQMDDGGTLRANVCTVSHAVSITRNNKTTS